MDYEQTPEEKAAHLEGPVAAANVFLELMKDGRLEEAWPLTDPELRLARVQCRLWHVRDDRFFADLDLDEQAAAAAADAPRLRWWPSFVEAERSMWSEALAWYTPAWGALSRPRPVDLDHELVVYVECDGKPLRFTEETLLPGHEILLHMVAGRWLVAAIDHPRYQPGWPPTYVDGSPAVS